MLRQAALAALVVLTLSGTAHADAIGPGWTPPDCSGRPLTCAPGTRPTSLGHSSCPSVCAPEMECTTDAECEAYRRPGWRCQPTSFCVSAVYEGPGMSESVLGPCVDHACPGPTVPGAEAPRCTEVSRCVEGPPPPGWTPPPPPPPPGEASPAEERSGGCSAAAGNSASSLGPTTLALGLGTLVLALLARRRAA